MSEQGPEGARVIEWPERCFECGRKATRESPDTDSFGCEACYPHWPVMRPGATA